MPRIYFYKLTTDNGGAPCIQDGLLSLAICKPMIRSAARKGDLVIGFAASSLHRDNRLIYVARVMDTLEEGAYFRRREYEGRADRIYRWKDGRFLLRRDARYHTSGRRIERDIGSHPNYERAFTLLSREFCYFGGAGSAEYKIRFPLIGNAVRRLGQGFRVCRATPLKAEVEGLLESVCCLKGPCVRGDSSCAPPTGSTKRC